MSDKTIVYEFDEICESQDFPHDHNFVEYGEYDKLEKENDQLKAESGFYKHKAEVIEAAHKNAIALLREACGIIEHHIDIFDSDYEFLKKPEIKELLDEN